MSARVTQPIPAGEIDRVTYELGTSGFAVVSNVFNPSDGLPADSKTLTCVPHVSAPGVQTVTIRESRILESELLAPAVLAVKAITAQLGYSLLARHDQQQESQLEWIDRGGHTPDRQDHPSLVGISASAVLRGSGVLRVKDEDTQLSPGVTALFVTKSNVKRKIEAGPRGLDLLNIAVFARRHRVF